MLSLGSEALKMKRSVILIARRFELAKRCSSAEEAYVL